MTKFFFASIFLLILGILFIEPFEKDEVALYPQDSPKVEKEKITLEDAIEIEEAAVAYKKKKLGKRNSLKSMNSIKRDEPLVMESENIPFEPLR